MAKKILLIDDDPNVVRFLSTLLEDNGYETQSAPDGSAGYEMLQEATPDLVILDVMMPKKTGFTLFKQLRRDEQYEGLPVLMLTGVAKSLRELDEESGDTFQRPYDNLREALRGTISEMRGEGLSTPDMLMDKPVDPESFIARVRELIGS